MMRNCQDVMTKNPTTCGELAPVVDAAKLMEKEGVGSIPVCEDGRLVGIVTDRDIAMRVVAEGRDPQQTKIQDVMTRDPQTVSAEEPISRALEVMDDVLEQIAVVGTPLFNADSASSRTSLAIEP